MPKWPNDVSPTTTPPYEHPGSRRSVARSGSEGPVVGGFRVYMRGFAGRSEAHARHRELVYFLRRESENRRRATHLLAVAAQARRIQEVLSALDVLLLDVHTVEISRELVELAEWGELDAAALHRTVDEIITNAEARRDPHGAGLGDRVRDCVLKTSGPLAQALGLLVAQESTTVKRDSWWCVKARVTFLDQCAAGPGALAGEQHPIWIAQLKARGWLPEASKVERPAADKWIARWSLTQTGLCEWAEIRKALHRQG